MERDTDKVADGFRAVAVLLVAMLGVILQIAWTLALGILVLGGWGLHIYYCYAAEQMTLLVVGALLFPVGIVNGWGMWLGLW